MSEERRLSQFAYYNTGGRAKVIFEPRSVAELQACMAEIHQKQLPYFFLGGGTNSLVTDEDWQGAVVVFRGLDRIELLDSHRLRVGAGVDNSKVVEFAYEKGLAGIAWMYGLPGQLGGTVRMNARCYGGEISEVTVEVLAVDQQGNLHRYTDPGIFRGYKDTIFMENHQAIAEVVLQLKAGDKPTIQQKMAACKADRAAKGQYVYPTCGCVFKNDYSVGVPSGMLLERAGIKSLKHQGAEINPHHANFLYNVSANSRSLIEATLIMRERVFVEFGVWLEYEMEILGRLPIDLERKIQQQRQHQFKLDKLEPLRQEFAQRSS